MKGCQTKRLERSTSISNHRNQKKKTQTEIQNKDISNLGTVIGVAPKCIRHQIFVLVYEYSRKCEVSEDKNPS